MSMKVDIIGETLRFAEMQGNSGRKVSRWIDQLFPNGEFRRSLEEIFHDLASPTLGAGYRDVSESDKHRPVLILSIKNFVDSQMEFCEYSSMFTVEIENQVDTWDVYLVIKLTNLPENIKGKQQVLQAFADVLSTVEDVIKFSDSKYLDRIIDMHSDEPMTVTTFKNANNCIQMDERAKKIDKYFSKQKE
jgi:hypothetical protein